MLTLIIQLLTVLTTKTTVILVRSCGKRKLRYNTYVPFRSTVVVSIWTDGGNRRSGLLLPARVASPQVTTTRRDINYFFVVAHLPVYHILYYLWQICGSRPIQTTTSTNLFRHKHTPQYITFLAMRNSSIADRDPCPYRIIEDIGGAFAFGAIGGGVWHFGKGAWNSPKGQ